MCTLYVLIHLSDTNTPHRQYWLQLPLHIARSPSRANGGAPVPAPAYVRPSHPCPTITPSSPSSPFVPCFQLLASQWWRSCSVAPVLAGANNRPPHSRQRPICPSFPSFPSGLSVPSVPSLHPAIIIRYDPVPVPAISSDTGKSSEIQR